MADAQWVITTYDQNLHAGEQAVFTGTHTQAVIEAERMINGEPQWSYQIVEAEVAKLVQALHFTVEYVGYDTLPPIDGWSWYDAMKQADPALAAHHRAEWERQHPEQQDLTSK